MRHDVTSVKDTNKECIASVIVTGGVHSDTSYFKPILYRTYFIPILFYTELITVYTELILYQNSFQCLTYFIPIIFNTERFRYRTY